MTVDEFIDELNKLEPSLRKEQILIQAPNETYVAPKIKPFERPVDGVKGVYIQA